jgi:hypothetical protein
MSQHEEYTSPPGFRVSGAGGTKLAPVLIDPAAPASEGDVITRIGSGYAPHAPSGGEVVAYTHSCSGSESLLTIPFPVTGTHATLRLLVTQPVGAGFGFQIGTAVTDQWRTIDPGAPFTAEDQWLVILLLPWFRDALVADALVSSVNATIGSSPVRVNSLNGQPLTSFDLLCYAEDTGDPAPFPAGTLVEVRVQ